MSKWLQIKAVNWKLKSEKKTVQKRHQPVEVFLFDTFGVTQPGEVFAACPDVPAVPTCRRALFPFIADRC